MTGKKRERYQCSACNRIFGGIYVPGTTYAPYAPEHLRWKKAGAGRTHEQCPGSGLHCETISSEDFNPEGMLGEAQSVSCKPFEIRPNPPETLFYIAQVDLDSWSFYLGGDAKTASVRIDLRTGAVTKLKDEVVWDEVTTAFWQGVAAMHQRMSRP